MRSSLPLAPEVPVAIHVDGCRLGVFMCSPFDLDELAVGHLLGRGIVTSRGELKVLAPCPDQRSVRVETTTGAGNRVPPEGLVYSACGAATRLAPPLCATNPLSGTGVVASLEDLKAWARAMFDAAVLYRQVGGLHVAALAVQDASAGADDGACGAERRTPSYFVVREDVGRHNAIDKVMGRALLDGANLREAVLLTSGRIAADMAEKAARAGLPILVSRSVPTTEAYEIARDAGITIVGRIGAVHPFVYTWPDRLKP